MSSILVVAPHPDDELIGVGGTMYKRHKQGYDVYVCIVTKGYGPIFSTELIETGRKQDWIGNIILGTEDIFYIDLPANHLDSMNQYVINNKLKDIVEKIEPEEVYIPFRGDAHIDHRITADKDEIFISKAAMLLCYHADGYFKTVKANEIVEFDSLIDWSKYPVRPLDSCKHSGELPDYVYDCHTLKGKRAGKTDWDMTVAEQEALYVKQKGYFDDASWIYTYEQDYEMNVLDDKGMEPIREFAKTHEANPVQFIPYDAD